MLIPISKRFKKYLCTIKTFFFFWDFINIWNSFLVSFKKYRWLQNKNRISTITIKFSIQITKLHRLKLNTSKILLIFNFSKVRAIIIRLLSIIKNYQERYHIRRGITLSGYHTSLVVTLVTWKAASGGVL